MIMIIITNFNLFSTHLLAIIFIINIIIILSVWLVGSPCFYFTFYFIIYLFVLFFFFFLIPLTKKYCFWIYD